MSEGATEEVLISPEEYGHEVVSTDTDQNTINAEKQWAKEKNWPMWEVVITGDEALWNARPGVNLAEEDRHLLLKVGDEIVFDQELAEGTPMPWVEVAKASARLLAPSEEHAKMQALRANPEYHSVESVTEVER